MRLFFLVLFVCVSQIIYAQKSIEGKVIRILDGDTFELLMNGNNTVKVRLSDIDAPEKNQDFGQVSKQTLAALIFSKQVKVSYEKVDRNQRIIGLVFENQINVNLAMVEKGMAWHFKKYSSNRDFSNAEIKARSQKKGIWSIKNPISPWEFRSNRKKH